MIFKSHIIPSHLSKYLVDIIYHRDFQPAHNKDRYLPDGTINIVFEFTGTPKYIYKKDTDQKIQECRDVWFSGVQKNFLTISSESEEMMVIVFKPGAGFPLLSKSVSEYTDKVIQAEEVFGLSIKKLHTSLKSIEKAEDKFQVIENWLEEQLSEDDFYTNIIQYAIDAIENSPTQINLSELSDKLGYSQKQFIQLFKKYVGITPKQFHRIVRFNEILTAVENKEEISWTIIAADCGYFDQAHFIKDFQSFSGINPKKYIKDIEDFPNFLPVK